MTARSLNTQKTIARRYGLLAANGNASGTFGARSLVAGARYPIRIRMYDHTSAQVVQLYWRAASGGAWTPVPFSAFWAVPVDPPTYASVRTLGYPEPRAIVAPTAPAPPPMMRQGVAQGSLARRRIDLGSTSYWAAMVRVKQRRRRRPVWPLTPQTRRLASFLVACRILFSLARSPPTCSLPFLYHNLFLELDGARRRHVQQRARRRVCHGHRL